MQISVTNLWGVITPLRTTTGIYALPPGAVNVTLSLPDFEATEVASRVVLGQIAVTYLVPPIVQSRPSPATITGTPAPGGVLTATAAGLGSATYQWLSNAAPISGATSAIYAVQSGDVGATISCVVTGTDQSNGLTIRPASAGAAVAPRASLLPNLKAKVAAVKAGTGQARLGYVGDSLTRGWGAGDPGSGSPAGRSVNAYGRDVPSQIAAAMTASGVPAQNWSLMGNGNVDNAFSGSPETANSALAVFSAYDPRIAFQADFQEFNYNNQGKPNWFGPGGYPFQNQGSGSGKAVFTPPGTVDSVTVVYITFASNGPITVRVNGTVAGTIATSGSSNGALVTSTVTFPRASNPQISLESNGNTSGWIFYGVMPFDSVYKAVQVVNMGSVGSTTGDWIHTLETYAGLAAVQAIVPSFDAFFVELGANDWFTSVPRATFKANLITLVTALKANGADVQLVVPTMLTTNNYSADWLNVYAEVAAQLGLPAPINLQSVSLAAADYWDGTHLTASGYQKAAAPQSSYLLANL